MKDLRLDRSLGVDELKDKLTEADLNPEWEADGTPSKLAAYMKEFMDLQQRGADMYMSTFKLLKQRFPFSASLPTGSGLLALTILTFPLRRRRTAPFTSS